MHQPWIPDLRPHVSPTNVILTPWYWLATLLFVIATTIIFYRIFNRQYEMAEEVRKATKKLTVEIEQRKIAEKRLRHQADHDVLTGLTNRRLFEILSQKAFEQAGRQQRRLTLYFMDIDGFKPVNDELGHDTGDVLLRKIAGRLKTKTRKSDILARLGGDEFVLLMVDSEGPEEPVAKAIIHELSSPYVIGDDTVTVGVSIGIACYPDSGKSYGDLFRAADAAMYRAKEGGKKPISNRRLPADHGRAQLIKRPLETVRRQPLRAPLGRW